MRSLLGRFHRPFARSAEEQLLLLNNLGDGSTLSLDFTTGVLDPRLTFTRSTSGTYIGADGLVKTATANTARFDYDPTSIGTPRGLLIEGSANNLATNSNLQAGWLGGTNTTVTANTTEVTSPDGTNNAAKIALTNTGYCSRFESITGLANATTYTFSYWIRGTAGNQQRVYSVTQGTDLVTQSNLTYTSTGWTRVQITFTSGATNNNVYLYVASRPSGTVNDVIYVYGCQLETGTGASSLIPTGASTGSRAFDSCVMDNITSLQYSTTNGSMYYEGRFSQLNTSSFPWRMGFTTETGDYRVFGFLTNSGGSSIEAKGPSATPTANVSVTIALNTDYKLAWSMDTALATGEVRRSSNGGAVSVSGATALTVTGTPTYLMFGQKGYGAFFPAGTIKAAKYWPTTLSDAQLQAITT